MSQKGFEMVACFRAGPGRLRPRAHATLPNSSFDIGTIIPFNLCRTQTGETDLSMYVKYNVPCALFFQGKFKSVRSYAIESPPRRNNKMGYFQP